MSDLISAPDATFFLSVLYNEEYISSDNLCSLISEYFQKDFVLNLCEFYPMKEYYSKEMGEATNLKRFFVFFGTKLSRETLISYKKTADTLEKQKAIDSKRVFNLDPGYITLDQVVLATGKPYSHRIYLGEGVYGELTYEFKNSSFAPISWTYPDYVHAQTISSFNYIRNFNFLMD